MKADFFRLLCELAMSLWLDVMGRWHQRKRQGTWRVPLRSITTTLYFAEGTIHQTWQQIGYEGVKGRLGIDELEGGNWVEIDHVDDMPLDFLPAEFNWGYPGASTYRVSVKPDGEDFVFSEGVPVP